jgi:HEPN domain-containing protein
MTNEEKVKYWVDLADNDLCIGEDLLRLKHYLYAGFMCHQTVEKIFKAAYAKLKEETPPFTHDLVLLAEKNGLFEMMSDEQKAFVIALNPLNIEARYPEYKKNMANILNHVKCEAIVEQTKALQQWMKEKILLPK